MLATKQSGERPQYAASALERLGNIVLLERPFHADTLVSAVRSALRGRRRQYQARAHVLDLDTTQNRLRAANETLEKRVMERTIEVESARETLAFALDSAEMGSWLLDLAADTTHRSSQHDRIFGYSEPLPTWGQDDLMLHVLPEDRALAEEEFSRALKTGTLEFECRIRRLDQAVRWIALKGRVEYGECGKPVRMAGIITDTTDRRQTEEALRQAQKMEAMGHLTGGVAHDFNNLLTVIVGGLDMVIRRPEQTDRVKRLAEAAMTAARRGEQLTQQLLAFSRRQMLRPEAVNPNRLLLEFQQLARRAAGEAVSPELNLEPGVDPIRIDPAQFEAAVLNLVVNARDAMAGSTSNGGRAIRIQSCNVHLDSAFVWGKGLQPGSYVMVAVTDQGSGIDPETLTRVFEPFFTTKEVGKGSGLGLAQVYGFARSAGGFAAIASEVGVGTTVRLYFPRSSDPVSEESRSATAIMPLRRANEGETVLLVEDDEQVRGMAIESLEELGYAVIVAENAAEALTHLSGPSRLNLLFSDVVMPGGMNGAQLAVEARRLRPELKVLLTSGYIAELEQRQVMQNEGLPVLNKPYRREELAQTLRIVLGGGT